MEQPAVGVSSEGFFLRLAQPADARELASIHIEARRVAMPYLPTLHTLSDTAAYFVHVQTGQDVWVAESPDSILGFAAFYGNWLNHLYVRPADQSVGVGSALLEMAKQSSGGTLDLWVFQRNAKARRFYERRAFKLIRLTAGERNEEKEPDAHYRWTQGPA